MINLRIGIWLTLLHLGAAFGETPGPDSLHFYNRAGCAAAAFRPATSALVIADSYNAGKLLHGITRDEAQTAAGMTAFRQTAAKLIPWLAEQILLGRAALLPENLRDPRTPAAIRKAVETHCPLGGYCAELDPLLDALFRAPAQWKAPQAAQCFYVREISRLQSPLYSQKPDLNLLDGIARDDQQRARTLQACGDDETKALGGPPASRNFLLQIDVLPQGAWNWQKLGHDFWHSLRLYLSWAWRRLPLAAFGAGNYAEIFKNLDLEEMLLFTGNGCETLSAPACDQEQLSIASLRDLVAKNPGAADAIPDLARILPDGPDARLLESPAPRMGSDGLHVQESKSVQEWIQGFRQRLVSRSVASRVRLNEALNQLQIITQNLSVARVMNSLRDQAKNPEFKPNLYALCAEFEYAGNQEYGLLRERIKRLTQIETLRETTLPFSEERLAFYQGFYSTLAPAVLTQCQEWEKGDFWKKVSPPADDSSLFSEWYRETRQRLLKEKSKPANAAEETIFPARPLLKFASPLFPQGETLCAYGADCAQRVLKNLVDVIAAFSYAESILRVQSPALATPLFNSLAEHSACRSYDPWFKTRKTIREFLVDIANTALFGWNPIPVYFSAEIQPGQLYSLKKLVRDGKLVFEPQHAGQKTAWSLGLDAGPLVGVPCVVVLKNGGGSPRVQTPYFFEGINIAKCGSKTNALLQTGPKSDEDRRSIDGSSHCVACQLSFSAQSAAKLSWVSNHLPFNPVKLGVYLIGTFVKLFRNLDDQTDIPREWTVNLETLRTTLSQHARIPKKCLEPLLNGQACEVRSCESDLSRHLAKGLRAFSKTVGVRPVATAQIQKRDYYTDFETSACRGKIRLFYDRWETAECSFFRQPIVQRFAVSRDCQRVVPALKEEFLL